MAQYHPEHARRWKGIFHVTMTVTDRRPLLGELHIPEQQADQANVVILPLGRKVVNCFYEIMKRYPQAEVYGYQVMPDHFHGILRINEELPKGLGIHKIIRGFWQGCNKVALELGEERPFEERPYIRILHQNECLQTVFDYVHDNPRRLAMKRLHPGYFQPHRGIEIAGQRYDAVGNLCILAVEHMQTIHVHKELVWAAERDGQTQPLRDYMNGCVLAAREGVVSVSPFISPNEQRVLEVLLHEKHEIIYLVDNGMSNYYKPPQRIFDACAEGRLLVLAPWPYIEDKPAITRAECQALNRMAESIVEGAG